jgi:hypothetical protein
MLEMHVGVNEQHEDDVRIRQSILIGSASGLFAFSIVIAGLVPAIPMRDVMSLPAKERGAFLSEMAGTWPAMTAA